MSFSAHFKEGSEVVTITSGRFTCVFQLESEVGNERLHLHGQGPKEPLRHRHGRQLPVGVTQLCHLCH